MPNPLIPALSFVIPAPAYVIPAKAGIHFPKSRQGRLAQEMDSRLRGNDENAQKYPSCFFRSMLALWSRSMTRPSRSEVRAAAISAMTSSSVAASLSFAPVNG